MAEMQALLVGYALGTLQVLVVDWVRRRRKHKANLRSLRAELERALTLGEEFRWEGGIDEDLIPKPPTVSPAYSDLAVSTEFHLTDEFEGDNAQLAMLTVLDGLDVLEDTHRQIRERIDTLHEEEGDGTRRNRTRRELLQLADNYNERLGRFRLQLDSGRDDLTRRLEEARYHKQAVRQVRELFGGLPEGENPEPLKPGDLRLEGGQEDGGD